MPHDPGSGRGPQLLERGDELDRLERTTIAGVASGRGQMLAIVGPAGIGKSTLLSAVRHRAGEHGFRVLTASGSSLERAFPFGICRQLLEHTVRKADSDEREALLDGAAELAGRLLLAVPPVGGTNGDRSAASESPQPVREQPAPADDYAWLHGLYWLTANLADRGPPVLLAVDDVHWADAESMRFLSYLARRLDGLRVAAVVAAREHEPGAADDRAHSILATPDVEVLRPASLTVPATATLVRDVFGTEPAPGFVAACHRSTGGNPFYLTELLRALAAGGVTPTPDNTGRIRAVGPSAISREVLGRVAHLGPGCTVFVRSLAVLGGRADLSVAAEVAGLDDSEATGAVDALARAAVVTASLTPQLLHPIMRAAIYDDIPPLERASAHRRAAEILASRSTHVSEVAVHLLHTRPGADPWTRARVREAAHLALDAGAWPAAVDYLRRALAESPAPQERFELMASLGQTLIAQGAPGGVEVMRAAAEHAPHPAATARAAIPLASALVYAGRADEAVTAVENALTGLEGVTGEHAPAAQLEALLAVIGVTDLESRQHLRRRLDRATERLRGAPDEVAESVLSPLAIELIFAGAPAAEAAAVAERALATGELVRRGFIQSPLPYVAAYALIATGRARLAERELDHAAERATREGAGGSFALISATRSLARLRRGDLRGALADAEHHVRLSTQQPPRVFSPVALATLVTVLVERGDLTEARTALSSSATAAFDPTGVLTQPLVESRARLCYAAGDNEGCVRELEHCRAWATAWGERSGSWPVQWRSTMALAELRRGNTSRAARLAREDVHLARRFGAPGPLGRALVASGLCDRDGGQIPVLREAVDVLEGSEDRLEHSRALVELGAAVRRHGRRAMAREPLSAGLKLARSCGATVLAERAYDELRASGARPPKILGHGSDTLTASELRIARMAINKMTNREIAQSLFVTQKTVEVHLSHAYQKLDISSRSELRAALDTEPAAPPMGGTGA